ncbi:GNAT family N-acetyltransferase [Levilactobacillus cerevisiae]|uniref:GNAT family N-acetyltransferase n=1 Tax=Levilactobacillus cerevisiae TaxID=1704076 RepID=UPI000F76EC95|nr:GNAT family N-acetyltransferase [Levilactobacillus cerevisiae]
MLIRPARADDDFTAVAQLYLDVWRVTYRDLLPTEVLDQLTTDSWHPERHWQHQLLAFNDDQVLVGTCAYGPARDAQLTGWGEVNSIYLLPTAQHQGIGRQLMAQAMTALRVLAFDRVVLWVLTTNLPAQEFYRRCGFVATDWTKTQGPIREVAYAWPAGARGAGNEE